MEKAREILGRLQRAERGTLSKLTMRFPWAPLLTMSVAFLWFEIVFKASTTGGFFPAIFFIALFSLAAGLLSTLLSSLSTHHLVNRGVRLAILVLAGVAYAVEYFVFCEFKVFYDLATVTGGASHAAHGFADQIAILVLNPSGIFHVICFMLPAMFYALFMTNDPADRLDTRMMGIVGGGAVAAHLLAVALISLSGAFGLPYSTRYSFPACVQSFGYLTSLRKELWNTMSGPKETTFSTVSRSTPEAESTDAAEAQAEGEAAPEGEADAAKTETKAADKTATKKAVAAPNTLDIDFSALAKTTDGTWAALDQYVAAQTPSLRNDMTGLFEGYNLIFISAEAFSAEAIREDTTPTLYRLANKGIQFTDYYQPASAGTTGGEYLNIFGMLPTDGGASVIDTAEHNNYVTMGFTLNRLGYDGWMFHNNDYTYYSRDLTHNKLGYNHGYMGFGNGMEQWVQEQWPESDLEMVQGTWENLYGELGDAKHPFNVYYMSVSGHSLYTYDSNAMSRKYWDEVAELPYSDEVKAYLAANIDLDRAVEYLVKQLEERKIANRTVIVIAADHFPYGLDGDSLSDMPVLSELYGHNVTNLLDRDHNRLIIWSGALEKRKEPLVVDTPTSSMDILPTLLNLFGAEWDSRLLPGRDVFSDRSPLVFDINYDWKTDLGTYLSDGDTFTPAEGATIPEGYVEQMHDIVSDKIRYCTAVLESDYYRHVFGEPENVDAANAAGKKALAGEAAEEERLAGDIIRRFKAKHHFK